MRRDEKQIQIIPFFSIWSVYGGGRKRKHESPDVYHHTSITATHELTHNRRTCICAAIL